MWQHKERKHGIVESFDRGWGVCACIYSCFILTFLRTNIIFFLSAIKIEVLYYFHSKDPANFVGSFG
jgi:hypothetical protein